MWIPGITLISHLKVSSRKTLQRAPSDIRELEDEEEEEEEQLPPSSLSMIGRVRSFFSSPLEHTASGATGSRNPVTVPRKPKEPSPDLSELPPAAGSAAVDLNSPLDMASRLLLPAPPGDFLPTKVFIGSNISPELSQLNQDVDPKSCRRC
jgi:hypothetical protein